MKQTFLCCMLAVISFAATAQTNEDAVKKTINNLALAMKTSDSSLLAACFADNAIMQTVLENAEGETSVKTENLSEFIDFVKNESIGAADERMHIELVKIDGSLASAWVPYEFYYKGQFSHCGVNAVQLIKTGSAWKIQYLADTRRKQGCKK